MAKKPWVDPDDAPELTQEFFDRAAWYRGGELIRPAKIRKSATSLRLDEDVLEGLRATGPGWQTRVNAVLRDYLNGQKNTETETAKTTNDEVAALIREHADALKEVINHEIERIEWTASMLVKGRTGHSAVFSERFSNKGSSGGIEKRTYNASGPISEAQRSTKKAAKVNRRARAHASE